VSKGSATHFKFNPIYSTLFSFKIRVLCFIFVHSESIKQFQPEVRTSENETKIHQNTIYCSNEQKGCPGRHIILLMEAPDRDQPVFTCFYPRNSSHVFRPPIVKAL
jgi:hypothetical protein